MKSAQSIQFDASMARTIFWILLGSVLILVAFLITPFINAIIWGAVLSVLFWPVFKWLEAKKWNWQPKVMAAGLTTIIAASLVVIPLIAIGTVAGLQIFKYASSMGGAANGGGLSLESLAAEADKLITPILQATNIDALKDIKVGQSILDNQQEIKPMLLSTGATAAKKIGITVLTLVIALLTMFFMLRDADKMTAPICRVIPLPVEETKRILAKMKETLEAVFVGVVFVALIQATLATIFYVTFGIKGWAIFGLLTFLCALIPVVGAPVVYLPLCISMAIQGRVVEAAILFALCGLIVSQIDNVLRPIFIGQRTGLHEMAVFFSLVGGVVMMGPVGMMAGPVLLAVLGAFMEVISTRRRLADEEEMAAEAAQ